MSRPIAIYTSYNIRYPLGGHVLAELHNIVGLQRLGYDVYVVEEAGPYDNPCFDPDRNVMTDDPAFGIRALQDVLRPHGLADRWCYVDKAGQGLGISRPRLRELCRESALLFSRAGVNWPAEFADCRTRVFIDTDPGFTQFRMTKQPAPSMSGWASVWDFHHRFTYGERLGQPDCPVPLHGLTWLPTRQPIVFDLVPRRFTPAAPHFTTVMSWSSRQPIIHNGEEYGQKDVEFRRIIGLPQRCGPVFQLAIAGPQVPLAEITAAGWLTVPALNATRTVAAYTEFIAASRGEFSVAVNLEVKARTGWFSDRTAAYLAAGKPVIVQDTGFSEFLPCGRGLFAFRNGDDVAAALAEINRDYAGHCAAAHEIAREYFASEKVLGDLLRQCGLPVST